MPSKVTNSTYNQIYFPTLQVIDSNAPKMQKIDRLFQYFIKNSDESARVGLGDFWLFLETQGET